MQTYNEAQADVLVIGGGIADAFAAIKAKEGGADVLLVDYPPTGRWFQGMPINDSADGIAMMYRAGILLGKFECGGGGARPAEFHCAPGLEMLGGLGCRFVNDRGRTSSPRGIGKASTATMRSSAGADRP